jgi:peptidoglycan/LPS O-acetylase OafA/YrhL
MRTIVSVQILRAVAASAVVLAHAQSWLSTMAGAPDALPDLHFVGWFAVDLFFVISGFIMVYTSEPMFARPDGPKTFMLHRLVRIVPFYWLVTAAYAALSLAFPGFDRSYGLEFIAASFLFIPMLNADGAAMPIVGHGWTLNYEMLFYSVFALAVFAPRRLAVALASGALVAAVLLGKLLAPTSTVLAFWTSPLILQFIYGMLIGLVYREGLRLAKPLAVALIVAGCASLYLFRYSAVDAPPHVLLPAFPQRSWSPARRSATSPWRARSGARSPPSATPHTRSTCCIPLPFAPSGSCRARRRSISRARHGSISLSLWPARSRSER